MGCMETLLKQATLEITIQMMTRLMMVRKTITATGLLTQEKQTLLERKILEMRTKTVYKIGKKTYHVHFGMWLIQTLAVLMTVKN